MGGGGTLVHDVPPSWVRASARLPPTVPRTQASWDETKVTEAASKSAMGAGAGVAGGAYADGLGVVTGRRAVGDAVGVPLPLVGVRVADVLPQAASSAPRASRAGAALGRRPVRRVMDKLL